MIHTDGIALISPWTADPDEEEHLAERASRERPDGLVSLRTFAGMDGSVLRHAQWRDDQGCLRWSAGRVPVRYAVCRSYHGPDRPHATMLATPLFACADAATQARLCDAIVENLEKLAPPGLLAAHLYASLDGTRVVNYAQWTDDAAWRRFVTGPAEERMRNTFATLPGIRLLNEAVSAARYRITHH